MDTVLVIVTGLSLALAAGMGMLLARMMREERERSDARVQLLEELAAGAPGQAKVRRHAETTEAAAEAVLPVSLRPISGPVASPRRAVTDLPLREAPAAEVVGDHDLFREAQAPSPWPRRVAVAASLAGLISLAVFGWTHIGTTAAPPDSSSAAAAAAPSAATSALELLSLRHSREGNTLTITGLVQNPREGAALANIQATLFVFGPNGTFLTSGRAPLDFTSLAPGDESPFVIRVPVSGDVARYRVGFRGGDDRVLAHVDRRTDQVGRTF